MAGSVTIKTDRLTLLPVSRDHAEHFVRAWSDPDVTRYLPSRRPIPEHRTRETVAKLAAGWEERGFGAWSLFTGDGLWVGYCGLQPLVGSDEIELFYGLAREVWNKGYASEAARAAVKFGFERLGLDRIVAVAIPENTASRRVMERAGMTYTRGAEFYGLHVAYYELTDQDFAEQQQTGNDPA